MVEFFIFGLLCYGLLLKYNAGRTIKKITILERALSVYFPNFKELLADQLDF